MWILWPLAGLVGVVMASVLNDSPSRSDSGRTASDRESREKEARERARQQAREADERRHRDVRRRLVEEFLRQESLDVPGLRHGLPDNDGELYKYLVEAVNHRQAKRWRENESFAQVKQIRDLCCRVTHATRMVS